MRKREVLSDPSSCLNRARDDEMIFVLLARDESSIDAVRAWIESRIKRGKNIREDAEIVSAEQWIEMVQTEKVEG